MRTEIVNPYVCWRPRWRPRSVVTTQAIHRPARLSQLPIFRAAPPPGVGVHWLRLRGRAMTRCALPTVCVFLILPYAIPAQGSPTDGFPLPAGAVHRFGNRQARHAGGILGAVASPDGKYLATRGNTSVVIWDARTLTA